MILSPGVPGERATLQFLDLQWERVFRVGADGHLNLNLEDDSCLLTRSISTYLIQCMNIHMNYMQVIYR